ncbi:DsbC family protein [Parahaliea sp. F7430]|uniref:Thiol:disulfide interchange protein n=1 Tax=Sediminihaliea albiluteola TaxID=2758564 RepID=A0A7W2TXG8_9GAMM|nr:DsbC family protein [Sediminihaliea albiluteola]MBA6413753.1 DsbC family protein [Sediminihaliea albiluteola]
MTNRFMALLLSLATALFVGAVSAGEPVEKAAVDKLRATMEVPGTGMVIDTVSQSEMPGMYEVQFKNGPLVYATKGGDFFVVGDLFTVGPKGYVNLADMRRAEQRLERLADVKSSDMIVFPAQGKARSHITVFTDVSCFYCQKLHKEVPELNKRGVEVRYLAYPRAGIGSPVYRQMASAWCADDRQATLTKQKNRQSVPDNVCAGNPVASQYHLAQELGVNGTPAIVTESGKMIPGYQSADELMLSLGLE